MQCMGGSMQGRLYPRNEAERAAALAAGYDLDKVRGLLCSQEQVFANR